MRPSILPPHGRWLLECPLGSDRLGWCRDWSRTIREGDRPLRVVCERPATAAWLKREASGEGVWIGTAADLARLILDQAASEWTAPGPWLLTAHEDAALRALHVRGFRDMVPEVAIAALSAFLHAARREDDVSERLTEGETAPWRKFYRTWSHHLSLLGAWDPAEQIWQAISLLQASPTLRSALAWRGGFWLEVEAHLSGTASRRLVALLSQTEVTHESGWGRVGTWDSGRAARDRAMALFGLDLDAHRREGTAHSLGSPLRHAPRLTCEWSEPDDERWGVLAEVRSGSEATCLIVPETAKPEWWSAAERLGMPLQGLPGERSALRVAYAALALLRRAETSPEEWHDSEWEALSPLRHRDPGPERLRSAFAHLPGQEPEREALCQWLEAWWRRAPLPNTSRRNAPSRLSSWIALVEAWCTAILEHGGAMPPEPEAGPMLLAAHDTDGRSFGVAWWIDGAATGGHMLDPDASGWLQQLGVFAAERCRVSRLSERPATGLGVPA